MEEMMLLALLSIPQIGRRTIAQVLLTHGYIPEGVSEIRDMFIQYADVHKGTKIPAIEEIEQGLKKAEQIVKASLKQDIELISAMSSDFPQRLKDIPSPPVLLFCRGDHKLLQKEASVAVIGTRTPSSHGKEVSRWLARMLSLKGYVIVSGLALGCDEYAHQGAIEASGETVAVMPCGLDTIYPPQNRRLAQTIVERGGCLLSEYPVGTRPHPGFFVERDRLQSALSKAVVLVETEIKGGAMHTMRFAQEQQRIRACYVHPKRFYDDTGLEGNRVLMQQEGILRVTKEEESIGQLCERMEAYCFKSTPKRGYYQLRMF